MARFRSGVKPARPCVARVKVWLEVDGRYVFGHGLSEILKAVEATGSIKAAAKRLDKSYRYIWGRIKKAEATFGERLVETRVGGSQSQRSGPTELARRLVREYDALRARMRAVVEEEFVRRFQRLPPDRSHTPPLSRSGRGEYGSSE